jgi:glycerol-3-phosphate dehydrogenase
MYDVAIIGGGVIGCAIARELARYELSAVLMERCSDVAEGTTKANSAIIHAGYDAKPGSAKARTNVAGNALFERWCAELDVPFARNTSLVVAFRPEDEPGLQDLLARGRQNGVPGLRLIDEAELRRREPNIGPRACAALLAETGGICCPYELTIDLATHALQNGVEIRLNCRVEGVRRDRHGHFVCVTAQGPVKSRILVNAAGVYADQINNQLSEDTFTITPRRGEYLMLDKTWGHAFAATIFQMPTPMGKGILVTPTVEDTVILGPTAEDIEDRDDVSTTAARIDEILRVASLSWADIPTRSFITAFSGIRAHCDRNDFILGESGDVPGLFNAAGIESPGLTAAPAIALELAGQIAGRLAARLKAIFLPPYHSGKPFRRMNDEERRAAIADDPAYGRIICRCEHVTEAEIRRAIRRPLGGVTVDGIKRRARAGMGRCQGGFCLPRVLDILSQELGVDQTELTKFGGQSRILVGRVGTWNPGAAIKADPLAGPPTEQGGV